LIIVLDDGGRLQELALEGAHVDIEPQGLQQVCPCATAAIARSHRWWARAGRRSALLTELSI